MKIEEAYSLDSEEIIGSELAYDYFWAGIIKSKRNFECPAENCSVQITCANLDKLRQDMKVDPYYKANGEHEIDCELITKIKKRNLIVQPISGEQKSRGKKSKKLSDIFELTRPDSHYEKKDTQTDFLSATKEEIRRKKRAAKSSNTFQSRGRYFAVRAFVSKYLSYKSSGKIDRRYINIKGYDVSYDEMFVEIFSQNLSDISKYPRIYFGRVSVQKRKESDFAIIFEESFSLDDREIQPSVYISKSLVDGAFTNKLSQKKLITLCDKKGSCAWGFVYGIPIVKIVNDRHYININISNIDYFDLRERI
jgi:hypothetical protein